MAGSLLLLTPNPMVDIFIRDISITGIIGFIIGVLFSKYLHKRTEHLITGAVFGWMFAVTYGLFHILFR